MKRNYLPVQSLVNIKESKHFRKLFSLFLVAPSLAFLVSCETISEEQISPVAESTQFADASTGMVGINVLLNTFVTDAILKELQAYGTVLKVMPKIKALTMRTTSDKLAKIQKLAYVNTANPDAVRNGAPVDAVAVTDFTGGRVLGTWMR